MGLYPEKAGTAENVIKLFLILLMIVVPPAFGAVDEIGLLSPVITVEVSNNLISVDLIDAPLVDVLKEVEKKAGFTIHLSGDLSDQLTMSLTDLPLDKGLKRLVGKHSLSLLYGKGPSESGEGSAKHITEAWIYSNHSSAKNHYPGPPEQAMSFPESPGEAISLGQESSVAPGGNEQEGAQPEPLATEAQPESVNQQPSLAELVEKGDPASVMAMAGFLGDEDKEVRRRAVNGIGSVQGEQATQILGQVLSTEPDPEIRMMAVRALAQRHDDMAAQAFLSEALNDQDQQVRELANQLLNQ